MSKNLFLLGSETPQLIIEHEDVLFTSQQIFHIMNKREAFYIGEFDLKTKSGAWLNRPHAVFWQDIPHPKGSNYFALFRRDDEWFVTDGISATKHVWEAVYNPLNNCGVYSAFRHDYQEIDGIMADGGPEYLRTNNFGHRIAKFKIQGAGVVLVE